MPIKDQIEAEIKRHQRLIYTSKHQDANFHKDEIKRLKAKLTRLKRKSKEQLRDDIKHIYERVRYHEESKDLMTDAFKAKIRNEVTKELITLEESWTFHNDIDNIFTSSKVRQKYGIE